MKAFGFDHRGGPEVIEAVTIETPLPMREQIQIETVAIGLNNRDRFERQIATGGLTVPGYDVAGRVSAVGSGVAGFAIGDRVIARTRQAYAETVVAQANEVAKLPNSIPFEVGAAMITPGATAYRMVYLLGHVKDGDTVVVKGAAGGVGSAAIQLSTALGASVIGIVNSKNKVAVERLGVEHFVAYDTDDPAKELAKSADIVINAAMNGIGGDDDVAMTVDNGVIVSVSHDEPLLSRGIRFMHTTPISGNDVGVALRLLIDRYVKGELTINVGTVLPFSRDGFVQGHTLLETPHDARLIVSRENPA